MAKFTDTQDYISGAINVKYVDYLLGAKYDLENDVLLVSNLDVLKPHSIKFSKSIGLDLSESDSDIFLYHYQDSLVSRETERISQLKELEFNNVNISKLTNIEFNLLRAKILHDSLVQGSVDFVLSLTKFSDIKVDTEVLLLKLSVNTYSTLSKNILNTYLEVLGITLDSIYNTIKELSVDIELDSDLEDYFTDSV